MAGKTDIGFTMGLDAAAFHSGLKAAEGAAKAMTAVTVKLLAVAGVALTGKAVFSSFGQAINRAKELESLHRQTAVSVSDLIIFRESMNRAGLSTSDAADTLVEMRNNLRQSGVGINSTTVALTALGLEYGKLMKMSLPEQFIAIAEAVNQVKDVNYRTALSQQLFGATGAKAAAQYQAGDFSKASQMFGKQAVAMKLAAPALAMAADSWRRIVSAGERTFDNIIAKIAPYIEEFADLFENKILPAAIEIGDTLGKAMKYVMEVLRGAFQTGNVGKLLFLTLQAAVANAVDYLVSGLKWAFELGKQMFMDMFNFGDLTTSLVAFLAGAAAGFAGALAKVLQGVIAGIMALLQYGIQELLNLLPPSLRGNWKNKSLGEMYESQKQNNVLGAKLLGEFAIDAKKAALEGMKIAADAKGGKTFAEMIESTPFEKINILGSDRINAELKKLAEFLQPIGEQLTPKSKAKTAPGEGPDDRTLTPPVLQFDELRKIGGGLGKNAYLTMAEKSLEAQRKTATNTGRLVEILTSVPKSKVVGEPMLSVSGIPGVN